MGYRLLPPCCLMEQGSRKGYIAKTAREVVDSQLAAGGEHYRGRRYGGGVIPRVEAGLAQAPALLARQSGALGKL